MKAVNWSRVAIVGTAQSWTKTPWRDPGLTLVSLNDAYNLPNFGQAHVWYDIHPQNKYHYADKNSKVFAHQVPPGYYVRPRTHKEWLKNFPGPVFLHPDHVAQDPDTANWPNAHPFPKAEIEREFGKYFTSTPAWIAAHAVMQGCRELHIYGIHLATEHEYIEQRPNFEFLCGRVLGPGKIEMTVNDGMRMYATQHGRIVIPEASPILASDFQYAFEQRPRAALEPIKWELHKLGMKRERIVEAFKRQPSWSRKIRYQLPPETPDGPVRDISLSTRAAQDELWRIDALTMDWQDQMQRMAHPWRA